MSTPGRLIVVEGMDGTGKSTLASALGAALDAHVESPTGADLRSAREAFLAARPHPRAIQLFYAATVLHRSAAVSCALRRGRHVVLDRYWASVMAYAHAHGRPIPLECVESALVPAHATFLLTLAEPDRVARLRARGGAATCEDLLTLKPAFRDRLARAFETAVRRPLSGHVHVLDTTGRALPDLVADALSRLSLPSRTPRPSPSRLRRPLRRHRLPGASAARR